MLHACHTEQLGTNGKTLISNGIILHIECNTVFGGFRPNPLPDLGFFWEAKGGKSGCFICFEILRGGFDVASAAAQARR
jgi:hypothetical protein